MSTESEQRGANSAVPSSGQPKRQRAEDSGSSICPTCEEEVSSGQGGIQCQWCHVWEHCKCAKISEGEYNMLSLGSPRVMFFCCNCLSKVNQSFESFDKMSDRQMLMDKRLQSIESKLESLSRG